MKRFHVEVSVGHAAMSHLPGVRRGNASDLPAIAALLEHSGLPTADLKSSAELQTWLVETGEGVIGVIALERFGSEALLRSLVVVAAYRKLGIGRRLVSQVEDSARCEGLKRLVLLTETAEPFFRSLG